ncbi:MAG: glycine cleavage system aminomethyltransferase GcvT [Alphaproteobacteria bacterium]|nr:glycine cleavage system aminomethyltransferase GcvT [Alphaproteobacteria bacterium]
MSEIEPRRTPLYDLHRELGAKIVPFAGYAMPLHYELGILAEHLHTRAYAGLFDVSHMGQVRIVGPDVTTLLEELVPGDIQALPQNAIRYSLLTNERGGILDDLMITKTATGAFLVVNAACKDTDFAHLEATLSTRAELAMLTDRALLALQGPAAATVLGRLNSDLPRLAFMTSGAFTIGGVPCHVSRSGYTGEDGYEISVAGDEALALARMILADPAAKPIGLGARDSLRLEAGLCLYGHDIDQTTTPIEAGLAWTIGKRRREQGRFPGADVILGQLKTGPARRRVGLRPDGRAPAREGADVVDHDDRPIGRLTSGGYGPSVSAPVAMGYVATPAAKEGTELGLLVRGKRLTAHVRKLPFVPHRYAK